MWGRWSNLQESPTRISNQSGIPILLTCGMCVVWNLCQYDTLFVILYVSTKKAMACFKCFVKNDIGFRHLTVYSAKFEAPYVNLKNGTPTYNIAPSAFILSWTQKHLYGLVSLNVVWLDKLWKSKGFSCIIQILKQVKKFVVCQKQIWRWLAKEAQRNIVFFWQFKPQQEFV